MIGSNNVKSLIWQSRCKFLIDQWNHRIKKKLKLFSETEEGPNHWTLEEHWTRFPNPPLKSHQRWQDGGTTDPKPDHLLSFLSPSLLLLLLHNIFCVDSEMYLRASVSSLLRRIRFPSGTVTVKTCPAISANLAPLPNHGTTLFSPLANFIQYVLGCLVCHWLPGVLIWC